ncbi:hypothetical protein LK09_03690 [Microbacterium mangrovi]|uniref:histidine kinase n=1 Tax=Microbacterium mangrovi TaxID=1348253 RepID=A0A0B2A7Q1_9MICO|nr:ATP-binding protein [Microbacterium mangrovi]KHK99130.1 hypothetical protein LK09_03690 [Microbacterium mangrovi]
MNPDDTDVPALEPGQAEDRAALAREIHDRVANGIMAGILRFDLADKEDDPVVVSELRAAGRSILAQALTAAQTIATGLRYPDRGESLQARIEEHLARAIRGTAIQARVVSTGEPRGLDDSIREHVFLLAREAVRNAVAHGEPSRVEVSLAWGPATLTVTVVDDGRGFELFDVRRGALGLVGMKERADVMGARLTIVSEQDRGTDVRVEVPYAP